MVLEHGRKQHRFVHHPVADALQCPGQGVKAQPGIGRNEVKIKLNGFHGNSQ
jgi:hypothetical protein